MKLMTLAIAVAATVACAHCAQARTHHHHRRHESHQARRHAFGRVHWARREQRNWRNDNGWHNDGAWDADNGWRADNSWRADGAWREGRGRQYANEAQPIGRATRYRGSHERSRRYASDAGATQSRGGYGGRPRAWCGWEMRHLVSGDPGPSYNLARNWAHWGHAGPAGVGAVVVWPHHVGKIVGREDGRWVIESGNDGHRLRTRARSISGAIAFRWG